MEFATFVIFSLLFHESFSVLNEEKISKVICTFSRFQNIDIFRGSLKEPNKLSKNLFKECNLKVRMVKSGLDDVGKEDVILFAYNEMHMKVIM